jgi:hypothetical protein
MSLIGGEKQISEDQTTSSGTTKTTPGSKPSTITQSPMVHSSKEEVILYLIASEIFG